MPNEVLFKKERKGADGRQVTVTAERGYGEVAILRVSDDAGEVAVYFHEADEVRWLGDALVEAGRLLYTHSS